MHRCRLGREVWLIRQQKQLLLIAVNIAEELNVSVLFTKEEDSSGVLLTEDVVRCWMSVKHKLKKLVALNADKTLRLMGCLFGWWGEKDDIWQVLIYLEMFVDSGDDKNNTLKKKIGCKGESNNCCALCLTSEESSKNTNQWESAVPLIKNLHYGVWTLPLHRVACKVICQSTTYWSLYRHFSYWWKLCIFRSLVNRMDFYDYLVVYFAVVISKIIYYFCKPYSRLLMSI